MLIIIKILRIHSHTHTVTQYLNIPMDFNTDGKDSKGQMSKIFAPVTFVSTRMSHLSLPPYIFRLTGENTFTPKRPKCWIWYLGLAMTDTHIVSKKIVALFSATPLSLVHAAVPPSITPTALLSLFLPHPLSVSLSEAGLPALVVPGHSPVRKCVSSVSSAILNKSA